MRNDAARGWKKVFGFTFTQYVRTKSFIVGTIIVCLITILLVEHHTQADGGGGFHNRLREF